MREIIVKILKEETDKINQDVIKKDILKFVKHRHIYNEKKNTISESENKIIKLINKFGLFKFIKLSGIHPNHLTNFIDFGELSKEQKYKFLDDTRERLISGWITDYYYSPMYLKNDYGNFEIQTWGYGNVVGEKFDENGNYIKDFELPYEKLPNDKLNELFELVLYGPYNESIYKSE